jgi:hypothetical protein
VANAQVGLDMGGSSLIFFVRNAFNDLNPIGVTRYVDFGAQTRRAFLQTLPRQRQFGVTYEVNF